MTTIYIYICQLFINKKIKAIMYWIGSLTAILITSLALAKGQCTDDEYDAAGQECNNMFLNGAFECEFILNVSVAELCKSIFCNNTIEACATILFKEDVCINPFSFSDSFCQKCNLTQCSSSTQNAHVSTTPNNNVITTSNHTEDNNDNDQIEDETDNDSKSMSKSAIIAVSVSTSVVVVIFIFASVYYSTTKKEYVDITNAWL